MFKQITNDERRITRKGFTLIEVLFVVIVIAIIAAIALGRITTTTANVKANACKANQAAINIQIEQYRLDTGVWPTNLADIVDNIAYFPDGAPVCPSGGTYSGDASTYRIDCDITSPVDHSLH